MIKSVSVRVIGAEGLVTKDNKPADPYARLVIGDKKYKTKKKEKTFSPKWNENFVFTFVPINSTTTLTVKIYDHDLIGKQAFLGTCTVRLEEHLRKETPPEWFPLLPREGKKDKVGGKLNLVISYLQRNSLNPTIMSSRSEDMDSDASSEASAATAAQTAPPRNSLPNKAAFSKSDDSLSVSSSIGGSSFVETDARYSSATNLSAEITSLSYSPRASLNVGSVKEFQHFPANFLPLPHSYDNLRGLDSETNLTSLSPPGSLTSGLPQIPITPIEMSSSPSTRKKSESGRYGSPARKVFFRRQTTTMSATDVEMRTVKAEHEARAKTLNIPLPYSADTPSSAIASSAPASLNSPSSVPGSPSGSLVLTAPPSLSSLSPGMSSYSAGPTLSTTLIPGLASTQIDTSSLSSPPSEDYSAWQIRMNKEMGTLLLSKTVFSFSPAERMDLILIWTKDIKSMDMSDIRKSVTVKTNSKNKYVFDLTDKGSRDRFYDSLKTTWEYTRRKFDASLSYAQATAAAGVSAAAAGAGAGAGAGGASGAPKVYTASELAAYQDKVCKDLFGDEGTPAFVFTETEGLFADPTPVAGEPLTTTRLPVSLRGFFTLIWSDSAEFAKHIHMDDNNVEIGKWEADPSKSYFTRSVSFVRKSRLATAKVFRTEKLKLSANRKELFAESSNRMEGIPFADQFTVESRWRLSTDDATGKTNIKVWGYVDFKPNLGFAAKAAKSRIVQGSVDGVAELAKATVEFLTDKIATSTISDHDKALLSKTKSMSSVSSYTAAAAAASSSSSSWTNKMYKVIGNKQNIIYLIAGINLVLLVLVIYHLSHGFALSNQLSSLTQAHSTWTTQRDTLIHSLQKKEETDLVQNINKWLFKSKEAISILTDAALSHTPHPQHLILQNLNSNPPSLP